MPVNVVAVNHLVIAGIKAVDKKSVVLTLSNQILCRRLSHADKKFWLVLVKGSPLREVAIANQL